MIKGQYYNKGEDMKKIILLTMVLVCAMVFYAYAEETSTSNGMVTPTLSTNTSADVANHIHSYIDSNTHGDPENRSNFEVGTYLDFIYSLNEDFDVGVKNSYIFENKEFTTLVGATVKFGGKAKSEDSWK